MTRRATIAATISAVAAYVDQVAEDLDTGNDLVARLSATATRANASNIRRAEPTIAMMVEKRLGREAYDLEQEGLRQ